MQLEDLSHECLTPHQKAPNPPLRRPWRPLHTLRCRKSSIRGLDLQIEQLALVWQTASQHISTKALIGLKCTELVSHPFVLATFGT